MDNQGGKETRKLIGIGKLVGRTFFIYKERIGVFSAIIALPVIYDLFIFFLFQFFKKENLLFYLFIYFLGLVGILIYFWIQVSLIFAVKGYQEKIRAGEVLKRGLKKLISFGWIFILVFSIITLGIFLFIVPGIIFAVWFAFPAYVLVSEDLRGMQALYRSRQLVKGYWWRVFARLIIMGIIILSIITPFVLLEIVFGTFLHSLRFISKIFSYVISALFVLPFVAIFRFLLYEDLKDLKEGVLFEKPSKKWKVTFTLTWIIGFLIIPAFVFSSIFFVFKPAPEKLRETVVIIEMRHIGMISSLEIRDFRTGYIEVNCNHPSLTDSCQTIKKVVGKEPTIHSSQKAFCAYIKLSKKSYFCLDSAGRRGKTSTFPGASGYCTGKTFICPEDLE